MKVFSEAKYIASNFQIEIVINKRLWPVKEWLATTLGGWPRSMVAH